jgi:hypothetical protein
MDALARLEPVARPLLAAVDRLLGTLGAPADHAVWGQLRAVGGTPADAVGFFARLRPAQLAASGSGLRGLERAYAAIDIPVTVPWRGPAGEEYAAYAAALAEHLNGDDSLAGRAAGSASYVDEVAGWQQRSRDRMARALADVLVSAQAVAVTAHRGAADASLDAVIAAADIGAYLLSLAAAAIREGHDLHQSSPAGLSELAFRAPAGPRAAGPDAAIDLRA